MSWKSVFLAVGLLCFFEPPAGAESGYPPDRMEALVAPIALYPDPLISSILAAAAHPDDVVAASHSPQADDPRWHRASGRSSPFPSSSSAWARIRSGCATSP